MKSIHDETSCNSAANSLKNNFMKNFSVRSKSGGWGASKPKGCSWHAGQGNVELWESSSGDCGSGYNGCFCLNSQGKTYTKGRPF